MSNKNLPAKQASPQLQPSGKKVGYQPLSSVLESNDRVATLRSAIQEGHTQAQVHLAASLLAAIRTGEKLLEVKALLPHGSFLKWIDSELTPVCRLSRRSAQRYMQMSERRQELVEHIRREYSTEPGSALTLEEAETVLSKLRIKDAGRLLPAKKSRPPKNKPNLSETDDSQLVESAPSNCVSGQIDVLAPDDILEAAVVFFRSIDSEDETITDFDTSLIKDYRIAADRLRDEQAWHGQAFIHPAVDDPVREWVERATTEFATESIEEALLLLPAVSGTEWLQAVDRYPRVYVRNCEVAQQLPHPAFIVGLTSRARYRHLQAAFSQLGQLFVPYSYPTED